MEIDRRRIKTTPRNVRNLQPPPDTTTGGEPGQTEEERRAWKHTLRKEVQEKAGGRPRTTRRPKSTK